MTNPGDWKKCGSIAMDCNLILHIPSMSSWARNDIAWEKKHILFTRHECNFLDSIERASIHPFNNHLAKMN